MRASVGRCGGAGSGKGALSKLRQRWMLWAGALGLLALFGQLALSAPRLSLTYDEPLYTAIGYADLATGDFRWHGVIGHGPLVNVLTAWPLFLGEAWPDPRQLAEWGTDDSLGFSRSLLRQLGDLSTTAWVTRVPIMWMTVLLAALTARWAGQMWGRAAGLVALWIFAFEPTLVAHGQLNTTDMGVTAFGFLGAYFLSRYLRRPSVGLYLGAGVALGAAVASKTSGHFWIGAYGLIVLLAWVQELRGLSGWCAYLRSAAIWSVRLLGWLAIGLLTLWAAHGFEVGSIEVGGLPVPMPSHWLGLSYQRSNVTVGQTTFLAGSLETGGNWTYFPLALLLKTPLPVLVGLLASMGIALQKRRRLPCAVLPAVVPPLAYMVLALWVGLNIGYRHLLPVVPFLCLGTARLAAPGVLAWKLKRRWVVGVLLFVWLMAGTLGRAPHTLAYFNELAGGPAGGHRYFADSTLEWGQGLRDLKSYLDQDGDGAYLAAFTSIDPSWYGLVSVPLPPTPGDSVPLQLPQRFDPAPGRYVISVTPLQGLWLLDPDTYDWFRHREPIARIGEVLWVYEVAEDPVPLARVVQCATPLPVLDAEALEEGFGRRDLDVATFDCERSWLYPGAGGWIVLPSNDSRDAWAAERLAGLQMIFRQRDHWQHPATAVYEQRGWPASSVPPELAVRVAPSTALPAEALAGGAALSAPLEFGPLVFLGYRLDVADTQVVVDSYWRVVSAPSRPLSLMAHLLDAQGTPVAIADGLGVPIEGWRSGDIIVQRHALEAMGGPFTVQLGVYWLDTLERWAVSADGQSRGDRLLIPQAIVLSQ